MSKRQQEILLFGFIFEHIVGKVTDDEKNRQSYSDVDEYGKVYLTLTRVDSHLLL